MKGDNESFRLFFLPSIGAFSNVHNFIYSLLYPKPVRAMVWGGNLLERLERFPPRFISI